MGCSLDTEYIPDKPNQRTPFGQLDPNQMDSTADKPKYAEVYPDQSDNVSGEEQDFQLGQFIIDKFSRKKQDPTPGNMDSLKQKSKEKPIPRKSALGNNLTNNLAAKKPTQPQILTHLHLEPLITNLRIKYRKYRKQAEIKNHYDVNDLKQEIRAIYVGIIKEKLTQANDSKITIDECKIEISQMALEVQILCLKYVMQKAGFREGIMFYEQMGRFLKQLTGFLKTKYPRSEVLDSGQLAKEIKEINATEEYQYDMLKNAGFTFSSTDEVEITKTIKLFLNRIIDELQVTYPKFKDLIESSFHNEKNKALTATNYKIGRKISQNTAKYTKLSTGTIEVKSAQIQRVLIKWLQDLSQMILKPRDVIVQKNQYKFYSQQKGETQVSFTKCTENKCQQLIQQGLINKVQEYTAKQRQKQHEMKEQFNEFNMNLINIFNLVQHSQHQVSKEQMEVIKFSYYNSDFISWIVEQQIIHSIKTLVEVGQQYQQSGAYLDLIKFKCNDLMRCQFFGNKQKILLIYKEFQRLDKTRALQIIKIKNRFETNMGDAMIFFKLPGSFIICECQLILSNDSKGDNAKKAKNIQVINHFLYELERSPFGVLGQIGVFLKSKAQTVSSYCHIIELSRQKNIRECLEQHREAQKIEEQMRPFVCSKCVRFNHKYSNLFKVHQCEKCLIKICNACLEQKFQITEPLVKSEMLKRAQRFQAEFRQSQQYKAITIMKPTQKKQELAGMTQISLQKFYDKKLKQMIDVNTPSTTQTSSPSPAQQQPNNNTQSNTMKVLSDVFKEKRIKMKDLFKSNKIKVEQIINYLQKQYQNQLKNDEKVMFVIATWKQRELKFKLYDYNQDQNNIVNAYQQLEKYEKHEFIRVSDFDLILQIKSFNKVKFSDIRKDLPDDMTPSIFQKGIYIFEGQDKNKMLQTYKKLISTGASDHENYVVYYEFMPFYLIIDFDHSVKGSKSDGWVEQYLKGIPDLFLFRKNIQLNNQSIHNKDLVCFQRLQWVLSIKILNLNENKISDISKVLENCVNIEELSIRENKIKELVFTKKLQNLKYLNAGKNESIERVKKLHNIINIQDLDLSDNKIQYIIVDDDEFPMIQKIDKGVRKGQNTQDNKQNNTSKNDQKGNKSNKNEEKKDQKLANNQFQQKLSQKQKFVFPYLTKLNLTQNKLQSIIQFSISEYPSLTELYLNDNQLYKLPKFQIPKLKKLDVSYNNLYQIDDFVKSQLTQLVELYLNDNKFWRVPALFNVPKLKKVDLCYNNVKKIQEFMKGDYPQLAEFYFTDNKIVTLPKFNTPKIQILHLDSNLIETMNEFIKGNYPELIELNLDKNKLTELPQLNYPLLKRIDFCQNQIKTVEEFAKLSYPNLHQIDLSYNKLTKFPKLQTPDLHKIVLEENLIESIKEFAEGDYPKLTAFNISYSTSADPAASAQRKPFSDQQIIMIQNVSKPKDSDRQTSQRQKLVSQRGANENPLENLLKEISHGNHPSVQDYYKTFLEAQQKVRGKDQVIEAATFKNMGLVFMEEQNYEKSIEFYQKSLQLTVKIKGENNIEYTSTLAELANVYAHCDSFEQALAGYQKALQILEKLKGKDNQNYISTLLKLAALYLRNDQKFIAVQMYEQSLKLQEKVKRKDSIQCSEILKKIGLCYSIIGDFTKSLQNYERCLKIQLKIKGKRTIEVAQTIIRIGSVYYQKGDNSKALQNYEKGVEIQKKVIGQESEEYAINLKSIIDLYAKQNLYQKAVFYSERYYEIMQKNRGEQDQQCTATLTALAGLHVKMANREAYLKALNYHEKCLRIQEKIIQKHEQKGKELYEIKEEQHLEEMKSRFEEPVHRVLDISEVFEDKQIQSKQVIEQKKQAEVQKAEVESRKNQSKKVIDPSSNSKKEVAQPHQTNPSTSRKNINPLQALFSFSPQEKQQITAEQQHFNQQKRNNHYNMGLTYHNIGCVYELLDDHQNALTKYEKCYEILQYIESDQSENSIVVLDKIGNIYYKKKGELHNSIDSYKLCLQTKEKVYGQDSNGCIKTLQVLAELYAKVNNYEEALNCVTKCHKLQQQIFGQDHTEVIAALFKKCEFLVKLQNHTVAMETLQKCMKLYEKTKSKDSIQVAETIQKLAECYDNQNLNKKAIEFAQKSLALKIKLKNLDAVELVNSYTMLAKVHIEQKNFDKSTDNINKALRIIDANPSITFNQHPMLYFYHGLINLLAKDPNVRKAIQNFEKSIQLYQKQNSYIFIFLASQHSQSSPSPHKLLHIFYPGMLQKLSDCYQLVGQKQKSLEKIKECFEIAKTVKGENHDQTRRLLGKMIRCSGENFVNQIIGDTLSTQRQVSMQVVQVEPKKQEKKESLDRLKKLIMGK